MTQQRSGFELKSVLLISNRLAESVEMVPIVTDLEIFEHIEKPYLTGRLIVVDDSNFYQDADLQGSEKIQISIRNSEEDSVEITKTFFISKIEKIQKIQDNAQTLTIHLVEDIFYISSLKNINRHYTGKISEIITKIASNFLDKTVTVTGSDKNIIEVIVPNMHPIEAMLWLNKKAVSNRGYPFYFYSTLIGNELRMENLGDILLRPTLNSGDKDPNFTVSSVKAQDTTDVLAQRRVIENHEMNSQENLLNLIRKALISSKFEYIDTLTENTRSFDYNSRTDLFQKLVHDDILSERQPNPSIDFGELINDKAIDTYKNMKSTYVGGSMAFRDSDGDSPLQYTDWNNSYGEYKTGAEYKLNVIKETMDTILKKNPLTININGLEFLKGDFHKTVGNNISISLQATHADAEDKEDKKKSGDYLIYSARHMFKKTIDKYDITMNCVKIGNMKRVTK